jgi:phage terminase large subunit-like protein
MVNFRHFCAEIGLGLEPFQRRIAAAAAGPESELVVLLPRGNGKTTLLAAIALHHLVTVERAEVYCAAASREQARILFEAAARFARVLGNPHIVDRHLELRWCPDPDRPRVFDRHLRVLAADAPRLHGLAPTLAIVDELHAHPNGEVYLALRTSLPKRAGKLITISTAASGADTALGRLRARALALPRVKRRGAATDARGPSLRMLDWSVPDDANVDDARIVKRANPASWITVAGLREQRAAVPDLAFRRYHANQWTAREGAWLPPGAWQACVGEPRFVDGEAIFVGVDVGGEKSATAVCWLNAALHVGCAIFHGDEGVLRAVELIDELCERYDVVEVAFDPWRFGQAAQELQARGVRVSAFPQTDARMMPASDRLHRAIVEHRPVLPADDELAAHAANAIAKHSRRGWRLESPHRREVNIDGVIALAMALDRAENQPEPLEVIGWL